MEQRRFRVPAMSCPHCVRAIERGLLELAGVSRVEVFLETKNVSVVFGPPADAASLRARLEALGYPAQD